MVEPLRHRRTKGAATDMFEPKATASHLDSTHSRHFAALREFCRYRGITIVGQARTNQSRFMSTRPCSIGFLFQSYSENEVYQIASIGRRQWLDPEDAAIEQAAIDRVVQIDGRAGG